MTKKKKRQLEEMRKAEEAKKMAAQNQQQQFAMYPGMPITGSTGSCYFPLGDGKSHAIQLPPIIQPIAMIPLSAQQPPVADPLDDDFEEDEFDDFEDWC